MILSQINQLNRERNFLQDVVLFFLFLCGTLTLGSPCPASVLTLVWLRIDVDAGFGFLLVRRGRGGLFSVLGVEGVFVVYVVCCFSL